MIVKSVMKSASLRVAGAGQIANTSGIAVLNGLIMISGGRHQSLLRGLRWPCRTRTSRASASVLISTWRMGWTRYNFGVLMNAATKTKDHRTISGGSTLLSRGHKVGAHAPRLLLRSFRCPTIANAGDISRFSSRLQEP